MDEPGFESDFLRASRVALWGLGLMGGSLAMALKDKCRELIGIDVDPSTVALARQRAIVNEAWLVEEVQAHPEDIFAGIDLIVLAAPVRTILKILEQLPLLCPGPAIVIDLGSTKQKIVSAMDRLPERFDPVGGHPMCGKEKSSLEFAEASIYQNAPFTLVKLERTTDRARRAAEDLARAAGARPVWSNAEDHDRWVATTSHVPYLLASALARVTPAEAAGLIGPGFRSAARLAGSSPRMMVDILATNTENVLSALRNVRIALEEYEKMLEAENYDELSGRFEESSLQYRELIR